MCEYDRINYNVNKIELLDFFNSMLFGSEKSHLNPCATEILLLVNQYPHLTTWDIYHKFGFPLNTADIIDQLFKLKLLCKPRYSKYGDGSLSITSLGKQFLISSNASKVHNITLKIDCALSVILPLMIFVLLIGVVNVIPLRISGILELILAFMAFIAYLACDYVSNDTNLSKALFIGLAYKHHAFSVVDYNNLLNLMAISHHSLFV